jgi:hypothetical protein
MRTASFIVAVGLLSSGMAFAQETTPRVPPGRLVAGGVAGFVAGASLGGLAGYGLYSASCAGPCEIAGLAGVAGAGLGGTIGLPMGVYLANGRRGRVGVALLASGATLAAGAGAMYLTQSAVGSDRAVNAAYLVIGATIPVLQISLSTRIIRSPESSRSR